jgi:hypothetical protein
MDHQLLDEEQSRQLHVLKLVRVWRAEQLFLQSLFDELGAADATMRIPTKSIARYD